MSDVNRMSIKLTQTSCFMDRLDEVIRWMGNMNINADISRYKSYIDDFYSPSSYDDYKRTGNSKKLEEKFKHLNDAAQECIQLVQIYDAFKNEKSSGFKNRLRKIVTGSDFFDIESPSDQGRDFLYELLVASWFKMQWGYNIDFSKTTDVVAYGGENTIYVECKRIKSSKSLERNLKKACKQLSSVGETPTHYKLIFIDIYNCISDKLRDYEYTTLIEMRQEVDKVLENDFRKQEAGLIENILTTNLENTLGVIFTTVRCLWLSSVMPHFYQDYKILTSSKISDGDFDVLKTLLRK